MSIHAASQLVECLRELQLLEAAQFDELERDLAPRFPEPRELARELGRRGWLTTFQVNRLAQGNAQELVLGPYVLLDLLGAGGMGQVFKARHRTLDRLCALKRIRQEWLASAEAVQRFLREARAAAKLAHPNVVSVYDADQVNGTYYLAMEYVAGTDLDRLTAERGPLPAAQACEYIRQAACGLAHAHERGLVHRDIKPHNLLLTADGTQVKVLDLGLALVTHGRHVSTLTHTGAVMGTPAYMAPEQGMNAHRVDIRADIYSLGCTLFHLLSGQPPFVGETPYQVIAGHLNAEPPLAQIRDRLPPGLEMVLGRMLAKRPEDRFQTPTETAEALALFVPRQASQLSAGLDSQPPRTMQEEKEDEPAPAPGAFLETWSPPMTHFGPASSPRPTMPEGTGTIRPRRRRWPLVLVALVATLATVVATVALTPEGRDAWPRLLAQLGVTQPTTIRNSETTPLQGVPPNPTSQRATPAGLPTAKATTPDVPIPKAKPALVLFGPSKEVRVTAGDKARFTVRVERQDLKGDVDVKVDDVPQGLHLTAMILRAGDDAVSVMIEADATTAAGTRKVKVSAECGDVSSNRVEVTLVIDPQPTLRFDAPAPLSLKAGEQKPLSFHIVRDGYNGAVPVSLADLPAGVSAKDTMVAAGTSDGSIDVTASPTAAGGTSDIRLSATYLGRTADSKFRLTVVAADPLVLNLGNSSKIELVRIPKGSFQMGSPDTDKEAFDSEKPQHDVTISKDFLMGKCTVTRGQFAQFVKEENYRTDAEKDDKGGWGYNADENKFESGKKYTWKDPSFAQTDDHPVVNVSWNDAQAFCKWASKKTGKKVELPTEAQWEYAARAKTTTRYFTGDDADSLKGYANVADQTLKAKIKGTGTGYFDFSDGYAFTAPVGSFKANPWGLQDMTGNVWQWCADGKRTYTKDICTDIRGPEDDSARVLRGGSWDRGPWNCRVAARDGYAASSRNFGLGFRVALRLD